MRDMFFHFLRGILTRWIRLKWLSLQAIPRHTQNRSLRRLLLYLSLSLPLALRLDS